MENKLRLQITEKYRRNVFINVVVPEGKLYEFDCILDKYENSYNDYQTLIATIFIKRLRRAESNVYHLEKYLKYL